MKQKLALLLLCYMTVSRMTLTLTLLWWMFVVKGRCQFSSSWCFLSMVTPWFVSNVEYLNIEVLKTYFSRFLTTSAEQLFHRALFDDVLGRKQCVPFRKIWHPQKNLSRPVYSLFKIPSNENSFEKFLQTLCNIILRRVTKEREFLKKNF